LGYRLRHFYVVHPPAVYVRRRGKAAIGMNLGDAYRGSAPPAMRADVCFGRTSSARSGTRRRERSTGLHGSPPAHRMPI